MYGSLQKIIITRKDSERQSAARRCQYSVESDVYHSKPILYYSVDQSRTIQ